MRAGGTSVSQAMVPHAGLARRAAAGMAGGASVPAALLAAVLAVGCGPDPALRITILGTTDVHGHLVPYDYATDEPTRNSLAQVATVVDSVRAAAEHVVLVDSGDLLQGTALNEHQARRGPDEPHPVIAAMNALAYDAAAIGNHEFNYGIPYLQRALADAAFPFVAANIYAAGTDSLVRPPYHIIERAGIRIGILGLTTPGVMIWDRGHVEGRLRFDDMVEAARRRVPELRARGAEVVVVAAHAGLGPGSSYTDDAGVPEENALLRLAEEVPGIDVIFAGHTRAAIGGRRAGGTLILHAGAHADHVAVAELTVTRTSAGTEIQSEGRIIPTRDVAPDAELVELVRRSHERAVAWLREPIGYTPDRWSAAAARLEDTPIADLITRVQRELTGADVSAAAVFRTDAGFGPGAITRRDILGLYTYPNTLRAVRIAGEDLRDYLEWTSRYYVTGPGGPAVSDSVPGYNYDVVEGVEYVLDLSRAPGERLTRLERGGRAVAPDDSLTLALNNYRQAGGGGFEMLADAAVVYVDEVDIASRIIDFVQARDTVRVSDVHERNWRLAPEAAVERLREASGGG